MLNYKIYQDIEFLVRNTDRITEKQLYLML